VWKRLGVKIDVNVFGVELIDFKVTSTGHALGSPTSASLIPDTNKCSQKN